MNDNIFKPAPLEIPGARALLRAQTKWKTAAAIVLSAERLATIGLAERPVEIVFTAEPPAAIVLAAEPPAAIILAAETPAEIVLAAERLEKNFLAAERPAKIVSAAELLAKWREITEALYAFPFMSFQWPALPEWGSIDEEVIRNTGDGFTQTGRLLATGRPSTQWKSLATEKLSATGKPFVTGKSLTTDKLSATGRLFVPGNPFANRKPELSHQETKFSRHWTEISSRWIESSSRWTETVISLHYAAVSKLLRQSRIVMLQKQYRPISDSSKILSSGQVLGDKSLIRSRVFGGQDILKTVNSPVSQVVNSAFLTPVNSPASQTGNSAVLTTLNPFTSQAGSSNVSQFVNSAESNYISSAVSRLVSFAVSQFFSSSVSHTAFSLFSQTSQLSKSHEGTIKIPNLSASMFGYNPFRWSEGMANRFLQTNVRVAETELAHLTKIAVFTEYTKSVETSENIQITGIADTKRHATPAAQTPPTLIMHPTGIVDNKRFPFFADPAKISGLRDFSGGKSIYDKMRLARFEYKKITDTSERLSCKIENFLICKEQILSTAKSLSQSGQHVSAGKSASSAAPENLAKSVSPAVLDNLARPALYNAFENRAYPALPVVEGSAAKLLSPVANKKAIPVQPAVSLYSYRSLAFLKRLKAVNRAYIKDDFPFEDEGSPTFSTSRDDYRKEKLFASHGERTIRHVGVGDGQFETVLLECLQELNIQLATLNSKLSSSGIHGVSARARASAEMASPSAIVEYLCEIMENG